MCAGLVIGLAGDGIGSTVLGGILGLVAGILGKARARISTLEASNRALDDKLAALQWRLDELSSMAPASEVDAEPEHALANPESTPAHPVQSAAQAIEGRPGAAENRAPKKQPARPPAMVARKAAAAKPSLGLGDRAVGALKSFFLGGNTVVRAGILVLLVGVSLLLKYAAEHALFPIELRMIAVVLIGMTLVAVGFWLRLARPGFSRTLQGGGVAVMYLVVFFCYRTYQLLPPELAFTLLVLIALLSALLAVLQNAMALVVIGQIGGFMAPVIAATGSGNHVVLFSYYAVLNLVIVGIAYFKAWRPLNVIGFVFTFGIGSTWGALRYRPDQFASTEPFLLLFFLMYLAIPVLFALRRPGDRGGWVDGSLVFGMPLATLILQYAMVKDMPFAMAYSTLGLAAIYVGLAGWLFRRAPAVMRPLSEALLAIGVAFATLAVPYGFDNYNLIGATWALEGAGLYWVGTRQQRWLSRLAGVALQGVGGLAVLVQLAGSVGVVEPFINTRSLAAALICLGSLFIARHAYQSAACLPDREVTVLQGLIAWGLLFWVPSGLFDINTHVPARWEGGAVLVFFGVTGLALELIGRKLCWLPGRYPAALLIPLMVSLLLSDGLFGDDLLGNGGWLGWPVYIAAVLVILRRLVPDAPSWARYLHALWLWLCAGFVAIELSAVATHYGQLNRDWGLSVAGASVAGVLGLTVALRQRAGWPFGSYREVYMSAGAGALVAALLLWLLLINTSAAGITAPLPYMPLLNPVDLAQLGAFAAIFTWYRAYRRDGYQSLPQAFLSVLPALLLAVAFIGFNAMLARSVHHFAGVPFQASSLWHSASLQVAFSISWTLIGLVVTVISSRQHARTLWIMGAALLTLVVVKLFLVDLAQLDALSKIGTFLAVGVLLLMVGYFAPVPPMRATVEAGGPGDGDASRPDDSREPAVADGPQGDRR
jgi:uncharacterized membrane protein